ISHRQRQEHEQHRQSIFQIYAKEIARDMSVLTGQDQALIFEKLMESIKSKQKVKTAHKPRPEAPIPPIPASGATPPRPEKRVDEVAKIPPPKTKRQQFTLEEYLR
ncbi:MAG: hypothetical protein ABC550_06625, partial [Candidatus Methanosuratincola petrocarbonis]